MIPNTEPRDVPSRLASHRCLAILRLLLSDEVGHRINEAVLSSILDDFALGATQARLRTDIQRLAQAGLVSIEKPRPDLFVLKLTPEGAEVASGKCAAEGVEPVKPDCPY